MQSRGKFQPISRRAYLETDCRNFAGVVPPNRKKSTESKYSTTIVVRISNGRSAESLTHELTVHVSPRAILCPQNLFAFPPTCNSVDMFHVKQQPVHLSGPIRRLPICKNRVHLASAGLVDIPPLSPDTVGYKPKYPTRRRLFPKQSPPNGQRTPASSSSFASQEFRRTLRHRTRPDAPSAVIGERREARPGAGRTCRRHRRRGNAAQARRGLRDDRAGRG
jgi:hypothetical protein